jgi:hypothetical protein
MLLLLLLLPLLLLLLLLLLDAVAWSSRLDRASDYSYRLPHASGLRAQDFCLD